MRLRRVLVSLSVAALALSLAPAASAATKKVNGAGEQWSPKTVNIFKKDSVKWKGKSGDHTIRAYGGNWNFSRDLTRGTTQKKKFTKVGTFKFYCSIHGSLLGGTCSGMCGKVVVKKKAKRQAAGASRMRANRRAATSLSPSAA